MVTTTHAGATVFTAPGAAARQPLIARIDVVVLRDRDNVPARTGARGGTVATVDRTLDASAFLHFVVPGATEVVPDKGESAGHSTSAVFIIARSATWSLGKGGEIPASSVDSEKNDPPPVSYLTPKCTIYDVS